MAFYKFEFSYLKLPLDVATIGLLNWLTDINENLPFHCSSQWPILAHSCWLWTEKWYKRGNSPQMKYTRSNQSSSTYLNGSGEDTGWHSIKWSWGDCCNRKDIRLTFCRLSQLQQLSAINVFGCPILLFTNQNLSPFDYFLSL